MFSFLSFYSYLCPTHVPVFCLTPMLSPLLHIVFLHLRASSSLVLSAQRLAAGSRASARLLLRSGFDWHQLRASLLCLLHLLGGPGQPAGETDTRPRVFSFFIYSACECCMQTRFILAHCDCSCICSVQLQKAGASEVDEVDEEPAVVQPAKVFAPKSLVLVSRLDYTEVYRVRHISVSNLLLSLVPLSLCWPVSI